MRAAGRRRRDWPRTTGGSWRPIAAGGRSASARESRRWIAWWPGRRRHRSGRPGVDLITVAQALHWFATDAFYGEVRRVIRAGGVLAVWTYGRIEAGSGVGGVMRDFYTEMQPYWPAERRFVDEDYASIPFPFPKLHTPAFEITARWTLGELIGYIGTWSAIERARGATGSDPLTGLRARLAAVWDDPPTAIPVRWPLHLRVARVK